MKTFIILITLFIHGSSDLWAQESTNPYQEKYNMEDLRALVKERAFKEFFEHAKDVRPSLRGNEWKKMVGEMAEKFTKSHVNAIVVQESTYRLMEKLMSWPIIKKNNFFLYNRNQVALKYLNTCYDTAKNDKQRHSCELEVRAFWDRLSEDPELGVKLAKLIEKHQKFPSQMWGFYKDAYTHTLGKFLCAHDNVKGALINKMASFIRDSYSFAWRADWLKKNLSKDCAKALSKSLKEDLINNDTVNNELAFEILFNSDTLDTADRDLFLTIYILGTPKIGDLFNFAWNNLKSIGQNYHRRQSTFLKIKSLDPLPGKIFAIENNKTKGIILDYVHTHFPEYMDFYAKTCLEYLTGKRKFRNGNPTIHCRELFHSSKKKNWVRNSFHTEFSKIPRY